MCYQTPIGSPRAKPSQILRGNKLAPSISQMYLFKLLMYYGELSRTQNNIIIIPKSRDQMNWNRREDSPAVCRRKYNTFPRKEGNAGPPISALACSRRSQILCLFASKYRFSYTKYARDISLIIITITTTAKHEAYVARRLSFGFCSAVNAVAFAFAFANFCWS